MARRAQRSPRERADGDVVEHRETRERAQLLERARHAQPRDSVRREPREAGPLEPHLALVGAVEAADALEQR